MNVYIVWMGEYDERRIDNVFSTRRGAEAHADALRRHPKMSQWDVEAVEVEKIEVVES